MDIVQNGVIDARKKLIGENGTINGFKYYAGHMCLVLVLPFVDKSVKHKSMEDVREFLLESVSEGDEVTTVLEDLMLHDGRDAQLQLALVTEYDRFFVPPTAKEILDGIKDKKKKDGNK